jgi:hypothetical protein
MNLFARPILDAPPANTRRVFWAFVALFLIGLTFRGIACATTMSIIHPDEHQQFLEQAYRMIHGYSRTFWEQELGMRHPIYPALLAAPLRVMEMMGVRNPLVQAAVIRFILGALALWASCLVAWQFQRRGDTITALGLALVFALSPDIVFVQTHVLSETTATIPFLLAVCWLDRRPILAGAMLGVCFGIRFQMGFLIGGAIVIAWGGNRFRLRGPFLQFALAALGSLVALGVVDWFAYGKPFNSPIQYFYSNIWQGLSKHWGVSPWYQYFVWLWIGGGPIVLVLTAFLLVGALREWKFAVLVALFTLGHMAVAHKEGRFLLPVVPLVLTLVVVPIGLALAWLAKRIGPVAYILGVVLAVALFAWRFPQVPWEPHDGYRSPSMLLYDAGQRSDLTGIGVLGIHTAEYGNYFFLQRDVPFFAVIVSEYPYFPMDPELSDRRINYVISTPDQIEPYAKWQPEPIVSRGRWTLYRLNRGDL